MRSHNDPTTPALTSHLNIHSYRAKRRQAPASTSLHWFKSTLLATTKRSTSQEFRTRGSNLPQSQSARRTKDIIISVAVGVLCLESSPLGGLRLSMLTHPGSVPVEFAILPPDAPCIFQNTYSPMYGTLKSLRPGHAPVRLHAVRLLNSPHNEPETTITSGVVPSELSS